MPDVVRKTHVVKETLDPEWGEQFDFHGTLYEMTSAPLEVELSDQDNGGLSKQVLGRASLPFGKEVVSGKAMEGALNTQGSSSSRASHRSSLCSRATCTSKRRASPEGGTPCTP